MLRSRSKYYYFLSPNIVSSLVLKGMGVVALAPLSWRDLATFCYFPDGYIEKIRIKGNLNRTFISVASCYIGQRVLIRKV